MLGHIKDTYANLTARRARSSWAFILQPGSQDSTRLLVCCRGNSLLAGLGPRGEVLRFDPALPPQVKQLKFSIHYRGHRVDVSLGEDRLEVSSRPGEGRPIQVLVHDEAIELVPGARHEFSLGQRP